MAELGFQDVTVDMKAVERALRADPRLRIQLGYLGRQAERYAKDIAPDEPPIGEGYIAGLHYEVRDDGPLPEMRLVAKDWKWFWVEFGVAAHPTRPDGGGPVASMPAYRVLRRTLDSLRR